MEKLKITYQGIEFEIERLPNGKFKKPDFIKNIQSGYAGMQVTLLGKIGKKSLLPIGDFAVLLMTKSIEFWRR